MFVQSTNQCGN